MQLTGGEFDVIVIGSGRSGRETALAATRQGCSILLISLSPGTIASMMWGSSDESPLKQELIQAFIPSDEGNGKNMNQPAVTIQTTLHQPNRESPVYVLQAHVRRTGHQIPDSDAAGDPPFNKPESSFGQYESEQSGSLREREMRIREKLLRRNSLPPKLFGKKNPTGAVKTEPEETARNIAPSIFQQRKTHLRKKLLDRPGVRENRSMIPPQPRWKEDKKTAPKRDYAHAAKDVAPVLLSPSKDAKGLSESYNPVNRPRKKRQHTDETAKNDPLTHRESRNQEKNPAPYRHQTWVWEDSKGDKTSPARVEAESKKLSKASKTKYADTDTGKKEAMADDRFSSPPPYHEATVFEQQNEYRTESGMLDNPPQRTKPADYDSEREKRRSSFIEKEEIRMILEQSAGSPLKREAIQLEDPYGYNAWEDIMPFSKGKGNNEILDASEKRRIALRGLRNLINNLG